MEALAKVCRKGEDILDRLVALFLILLILLAGYSLFHSLMVYRGGFADQGLMSYKPVPGADGKNPSLYDLMKINEDVIGWVDIEDTHIDQPIVQGDSNMQYVNTDVYGKFSLSGAIFLDTRNKKDFTDHYNLLYGHHMEGGGMFGDLLKFEKKDFFDKHRKGKLYLPDKTYDIEIFMVVGTDAYDYTIFDPKYTKTTQEIFDYISQKAIHKRDIDLLDFNIIGLSTCERATSNGRTIVYGLLKEAKFEKKNN